MEMVLFWVFLDHRPDPGGKLLAPANPQAQRPFPSQAGRADPDGWLIPGHPAGSQTQVPRSISWTTPI